MKRRPLRLGQKHWRSRWLVTPSWNRLHRVSTMQWEGEADGWGKDQRVAGEGTTLCGVAARLFMPGIASRMDLERCRHCCRLMGIPQGIGAPFNRNIKEPGER